MQLLLWTDLIPLFLSMLLTAQFVCFSLFLISYVLELIIKNYMSIDLYINIGQLHHPILYVVRLFQPDFFYFLYFYFVCQKTVHLQPYFKSEFCCRNLLQLYIKLKLKLIFGVFCKTTPNMMLLQKFCDTKTQKW